MTLSVIIITKNEENAIRDCLESVKWATEIIVLDSGSTDGTVAICKQYTDKVFTTDWPGFGIQKNELVFGNHCDLLRKFQQLGRSDRDCFLILFRLRGVPAFTATKGEHCIAPLWKPQRP